MASTGHLISIYGLCVSSRHACGRAGRASRPPALPCSNTVRASSACCVRAPTWLDTVSPVASMAPPPEVEVGVRAPPWDPRRAPYTHTAHSMSTRVQVRVGGGRGQPTGPLDDAPGRDVRRGACKESCLGLAHTSSSTRATAAQSRAAHSNGLDRGQAASSCPPSHPLWPATASGSPPNAHHCHAMQAPPHDNGRAAAVAAATCKGGRGVAGAGVEADPSLAAAPGGAGAVAEVGGHLGWGRGWAVLGQAGLRGCDLAGTREERERDSDDKHDQRSTGQQWLKPLCMPACSARQRCGGQGAHPAGPAAPARRASWTTTTTTTTTAMAAYTDNIYTHTIGYRRPWCPWCRSTPLA